MFFLLKKQNSDGYFIKEVRPEEAEIFRNSCTGNILDEDPTDIEALREKAEVLLIFTPIAGPVEILILED